MGLLERLTARDVATGVEHSVVTLCCVIPAYRAAGTISDVVASALDYCETVVVVDDACPEQTWAVVQSDFSSDPRVHVVRRHANGGVGAAMKTGIDFALDRQADVIVKLDADGQMDPSFIPMMREAFVRDPALVCVKGNRFFDPSVITLMPRLRLFGNAVLSLLVKFASGYWNIIDPTNGYMALNARILRLLPWQSFGDSYFFETSVLCELGLKRLPIMELEMPTIYTSAPSSLSIRRVALEFPAKLARLTLRRLLVQYFALDINLGTLYMVFGTLLTLFAVVFGGYEWAEAYITHIGRPTGTVMLAVLTFLMGFQLLLNALMYDVQFSEKTLHQIAARSALVYPDVLRSRQRLDP